MTGPAIFTIGHSTHTIDAFIDMLDAYGVQMLVDVRTMPRSAHNPQFNHEALSEALAARGKKYAHLKPLGGLRHAKADSVNGGWRNASFRGYADHMESKEFQTALKELVALSHIQSTAVMCAEAVPWRCHRSLISDALIVRDIPVVHILSERNSKPHMLTDFAHVSGHHLTYPPSQYTLFSEHNSGSK